MLLLLFHLHRTLAAVEKLLKCNQLLLVHTIALCP